MASAKASKEPSMEDILASIRQIIADDDNKAPASEAESVDSGEPANDQAAIDAAFDNADDDDDAGMAVDDIDALFDEASGSDDEADEGEDDDDVLTLTNDEPAPAAADMDDDISFDGADLDDMPDEITVEVANEPPSVAPPPPPQPVAAAIPEDLPSDAATVLMSEAASASVRQSFGALSSAMTVSRSTTIEDLMSEMMRPMLKAWLDENLPPMVERMVKAEIERMRG
ncbi:MAG: DUF2497 domain-containing protein [Pseudomonadota bacterium]